MLRGKKKRDLTSIAVPPNKKISVVVHKLPRRRFISIDFIIDSKSQQKNFVTVSIGSHKTNGHHVSSVVIFWRNGTQETVDRRKPCETAEENQWKTLFDAQGVARTRVCENDCCTSAEEPVVILVDIGHEVTFKKNHIVCVAVTGRSQHTHRVCGTDLEITGTMPGNAPQRTRA